MLRDRGAFVDLFPDVLLIGTYSGPGACVQADFDMPVFQERYETITDSELGAKVRLAWSNCREKPINYDNMLGPIMELRGVKTQKALFKDVKSIGIHLMNGLIYMYATVQDRVGGFSGIPNTRIELPESASDEELGAAIRLTLERSKSKK